MKTLILFWAILLCAPAFAQTRIPGNTDQQFEFSNISFNISGPTECAMIGEIKNISGQDQEAQDFTSSFYDGKNKLLEVVAAPGIINFKNGETRSFEVMAYSIPNCQFASYKIDSN